jgi:hypothetical protein
VIFRGSGPSVYGAYLGLVFLFFHRLTYLLL